MALTSHSPASTWTTGARSWLKLSSPLIVAALALVLCVSPTVMVLMGGLKAPAMDAGAEALFRQSIIGTLELAVFAGAGVAVLGAGAAWLVTVCAFPGRRVFEWMLVLPLAAPVYVLAYAYGALTGPGGPAPLHLSGALGAGWVYVLGFYPYVYLSARAAFISQSVCAFEASRTLGGSPWRTFWTIALPLAWPGVAAGVALAGMEIVSDYGAAAYFGASTITTGVFRAWFSRGEPELAMRLASLLLLGAFALLAIEWKARGKRRFDSTSARWRALPRFNLKPASAAAATLFCASLVFFGALLPFAWLLRLASFRPLADLATLAEPLVRSLALAGAGSLVTLLLSVIIAANARGRQSSLGALAAAMGYAAPGAVTALGALMGFAALRHAGLSAGLGGALSLAALFWVYASRFAAAGVQSISAGLTRVTPHMSDAARTMGASAVLRFLRVDLPVAAPGAFAGALIIFVEILKELPATMVLRPFDFETLAVRANAYASDERLTQAAAPALLIVLAGLIPVIVLSRRLAGSRAGYK